MVFLIALGKLFSVFHYERQSNLFSYIRANIEITESSDFIQVDIDIFDWDLSFGYKNRNN